MTAREAEQKNNRQTQERARSADIGTILVEPAPESDVDVGMRRVEMRHGRPFMRHVEIGFHRSHRSRVSRGKSSRSPNSGEIISFQIRGSRLLPLLKPKRNIDASSFCRQPSLV